MRYEIKVGRINRVIDTDDKGQIEYIDETHVSDIEQSDIKECAVALARHQLDEGYINLRI